MIALGSDHGGYSLKEAVKAHLDEKGVAYKDFGAYKRESCSYADMAVAPCNAVLDGQCEKALLFCGTGVGISIAANKMRGVRAVCCSDAYSAKYSRLHNNANALCLGGRVVGEGLACELVDIFLNTAFEGGRHAERVAGIAALEQNGGL